MENKYFVFMKLSRTSYDGASIYKEFDDIKSAKLFVTDCETATSDRFDEDKDLKDVLEDEELFKKTFPYFYKKWVESFEKNGDEPYFDRDSIYEGAIPEEITMVDDEYVRSIDFKAIISGGIIEKSGWKKNS